MIVKCTSLTTIGTLVALLMVPGVALSDCASASNKPDKCIDIDLPGGGNPPSIPKPVERIDKTTNGKPTTFGFGLPAGAPADVYVIFKCQDYKTDPPDCRTPAYRNTGSGNASGPTWAMKLMPNGVVTAEVNGTLDKCDSCANESYAKYEECVQQYCRYPYMIVDLKGNSITPDPPLDPDVVVDPM